ncbi:MAG TPA: phosphate ABC transporter substrate-binding protein PstS [Gallionellaceae bacterium]|nr:phosphate ABC transporter substrate-binding protein PstS [Gallionellaceae bacterium]
MTNSLAKHLCLLLCLIPSAFAGDIHGAGATFPAPVYQKWAAQHSMRAASNVDYLGVGSGEGLKRIDARVVDFAGSDMPLKQEELNQKNLLQFPMLMGAVTPVINLPGILQAQLKLDGATLAGIYLGKIRQWNDPQLRNLNPELKLPELPITVIYREDKSGTTFNFTNYLSKVSPDWKNIMGEGLSVNWVAGQGAKGNAGIAAKVKTTAGAIGYVEYAFAMEQQLNYVQLKNRDGQFVKPNAASTQAAAESAQWDPSSGFYQVLTNAPGHASWPIVATTFILIPKEMADADHAREVLRFFDGAYRTGELSAVYLDYVMLPKTVMAQVRTAWSGVISKDGKPVWN